MRDYLVGILVIVGISFGLAVSLWIFEASPLARVPEALGTIAYLAMLAVFGIAGWLMWCGIRSNRP